MPLRLHHEHISTQQSNPVFLLCGEMVVAPWTTRTMLAWVSGLEGVVAQAEVIFENGAVVRRVYSAVAVPEMDDGISNEGVIRS
jgi:hypothetical protein